MSEKLLQDCPKCSEQILEKNCIGNTVICSNCNSHFSLNTPKVTFWSQHHAKIMVLVLILGLGHFSFLLHSNWDRIMKKDSPISTYIKHYWDDLKEDNLINIIIDCKQKNDFQCQMLAYKKLTELDPKNKFYQKNYEAKTKRYKNPPRLELPEDI